ncbi:MAG: OmpA family protein [Candidatus Kapabacteria bacterium]|nr:OmpA family protein [Candidatus Kapabacteria bacterium]
MKFILIIFSLASFFLKSFALEKLCILPWPGIPYDAPKKENLGHHINTEYSELSPIISADGKTLYFCRDNHPNNSGDKLMQDIWYSTLDNTGHWTKAVNIGAPLNTETGDFVCSVSPDGNTLLVSGRYLTNGEKTHGVSITHRTSDGWSFPEKLDIDNYTNKNSYSSFSLTNSGKVLLMAIEGKDSFGDRDIYASFLIAGNHWSEPKNLGNIVNTPFMEDAPFLAPDGVTLYFASIGHCGYGNGDIFVTRRLDSTWTNWAVPENLGPSINTPDFDTDYTISASGDYAYLVSTANSYGKEDIFRIKLKGGGSKQESTIPKPVIFIFGKVFDKKTQAPVEAVIHYELLSTGVEYGIANSNPINGEYKIVLPAGEFYGFRAEAKGYIPINSNLDATRFNEYKEFHRDLELIKFQENVAIRLNNVFFDYNKFDLKPESVPELNRLILFMEDNPNIAIKISGHTDNIGGVEYNNILSQKRAQVVAAYLISNHIKQSRVQFKGYGSSKPIASNDTEEDRQQNRRVEFTIVKQ